VEALKVGHPVVLNDVYSDPRWPRYFKSLLQEGYRSAMGVPLQLGDRAAGVLNFFAPVTGVFTRDAVSDAEALADMASRILRLAVGIAGEDRLAEDLRAAMESRIVVPGQRWALRWTPAEKDFRLRRHTVSAVTR
jgi:GAF domain-containing protein